MTTSIGPYVFAIATFLSVTWGIYLVGTILAYRDARQSLRRRQDVVVALRRFIVAFCIWLFVFSFVFRALTSFLGVEDAVASQVVFFALAGSNVVGSIFAIVSLRYD